MQHIRYYQLAVYLRCPIEILRQRIKHRGRPEEQTMDWGFLEEMQKHEYYLSLYLNLIVDEIRFQTSHIVAGIILNKI